MAQFPGGNRMPKKRTPVRRKATGNRDRWPVFRRPSRITGRIPGLVPGPKRVLTWAGELMKANG
jgi:hypothetical protein